LALREALAPSAVGGGIRPARGSSAARRVAVRFARAPPRLGVKNVFGMRVRPSVNSRGVCPRGIAPRFTNCEELPKNVCCHHSPVDGTRQLT